MKKIRTASIRNLAIAILFCSSVGLIENAKAQSNQGLPINQKLFDELVLKDSLMFNAVFNTCNLKDIKAALTEDFEFYPDNGSSTYTSHQTLVQFLDDIQKNFCEKKENGKVKMRREIEQGSLQVYPLNANQVVQTGIQHFYVIIPAQKDKQVEVSRFTRTWQKKDGNWRMSKEFDAFSNTYANQLQDSLYDIIAHEDSLLFNAYNAHDVEKIKTFFTEDLEFYHDKGGLTNYKQNMEAFTQIFKNNKDMRRELVAGSIEVYPVKGFGAMEIGAHKFCHEENGKQDCGTFKFAMVWKKTNEGWKISRVLSYGH